MPFANLGLSEALSQAVAAAGYNEPTPVQQRAIPAVLSGRDLMVAAQTGTGKTGGFALPVLEKLFPAGHPDREHRHGAKQARVLVLTPTRELAAQVHDSFQLYARDLPLNSACIFGGVGMTPQIKKLSKGVDVLVACPGRLLDLLGQNAVDLSQVEILVLDEADRMLDMGFIHDVKKVLARLPAKRQNLLFSATFNKDIIALANRLLDNPERIEVTPPNTTVERIAQAVYRLENAHKRPLLAHLITQGAWEQVLVFTRTKHGANRLAEYLIKQGLTAAAIHGNKSQNARTKALADFKANEVRVLVATDIAARGLDIDQLPHVVNYELPNVEEDYVHRIGRTGRAGRSGEAISLVAPDEEKLLKAIEKFTQQKIPAGDNMGFDAGSIDLSQSQDAPRPPRQGRGHGRGDKPRHENNDASSNDAQKKRRRRGKKPSESAETANTTAATGENLRNNTRDNNGENRPRKPRGEQNGSNPRNNQERRPANNNAGRGGQPRQPGRKPFGGHNMPRMEDLLDTPWTRQERERPALLKTLQIDMPDLPDNVDDDFGNRVDYVPKAPAKPSSNRRRGGGSRKPNNRGNGGKGGSGGNDNRGNR